MKKHVFKKAISVLLALFLCVSPLSGCVGQTPTTPTEPPETNETAMQLLGFESYEEVTGTKIAVGNMLGEMEINTDKAYITQGDASMKVAVQGDYSKPNQHPYFKLDFLNTTCATCDFTEFKSISVDVYNATDAELHIKLNLNVGQQDGNNISTSKTQYTLAPNVWTTCTYDLSLMAGFPIYDFSSVRYMTVEFMEHKQNREDVPNALYFDNLVGNYWAEGEEPETITYDFYEGIDFETAGKELAFYGQGQVQDAEIERIAYADAGVTAPANGGSYALKVSHTSNCWPCFRVDFGKTLTAGTTITFDVYGNYDYEAAADVNKYVKLELSADSKKIAKTADPNQVVWTLVETWKGALITLTADSDHVDFFYNVADGQHGEVPSWILLDNFKAKEPEVRPDPVGDFIEGIGFETEGNELFFSGTGAIQDATIDRVTYEDAGVTAPANGGSYALKLSHGSHCWPSFRVDFGKTLKAGTTITFDFYSNYDYEAAAGVNKYVKLELSADSKKIAKSSDPNQVVWTLVETWKGALITLTADSDHVEFFYNVADGQHGEPSSWILLDNFKAVEPVVKPDPVGDFIEGIDFETEGNELFFSGTGAIQDATIDRVTYEDAGVNAPANGGSYALKLSHNSHGYPTFRINFGKTLKAGTVIIFDAYGDFDFEVAADNNKYMKIELSGDSRNNAAGSNSEAPNMIVWMLVNTWSKDQTITLTADCSYVDLFYNVAEVAGEGTETASYILLDNFKAVEPEVKPDPVGDITGGFGFEADGNELYFAGTGTPQDIAIGRVTYADAGVTAPANGGSYALKVSHTSNCWPNFRVNFGKTLKAGTTITFDFYSNYDYEAAAGVNKYVKLELTGDSKNFATSEDPKQVVWTLVETWRVATITLTADSDHLDLFYNVADGQHGEPSCWILLDNVKAVEPLYITEGFDFESSDDVNAFSGTGTPQDIAIGSVSYADANVSAPTNGGSYALKVSHTSNCWPNFRVNFGKTLKAGTVITFDFYSNYDYEAAAGVNKYVKLELTGDSKNFAKSEDSNQVVWTLVGTWKVATITLTADSDHLDLFYNVADGQHGDVPSWILLDNVKATEPVDFSKGVDFEAEENELLFAGLTQGTAIDRVTYADAGVTAPTNGGSYALKISHTSDCWPNFRVNFGKTLKAGTVITFDFYSNYDYEAAAGVNKYVKLELTGDSKNFAKSEDPKQVVWTLVENWRVATITLTADSDHLDLFYNVADGQHGNVPSWILLDNVKAVEPN